MKKLTTFIYLLLLFTFVNAQITNPFNSIDNTLKLPELNTINTQSINNSFSFENNITIQKPTLLIDGHYKPDGRMIFNPEQKQDGLYIRVLNGRKTYMIDED